MKKFETFYMRISIFNNKLFYVLYIYVFIFPIYTFFNTPNNLNLHYITI